MRHEFVLDNAYVQCTHDAAHLQRILDLLPQMVWANEAEGQRFYYNAKWREFTGVDLSDGSSRLSLIHPKDRERALLSWHEAQRSGSYEMEYRLRHRSGEYRWVVSRGNPRRDESGVIVGWYGTCTDIHERRIAANALKRSEAAKDHAVRRYQEVAAKQNAIFDCVDDGIILHDAAGIIVRVNAAVGTLFGYKASELVGKNVRILFETPPTDAEIQAYVESRAIQAKRRRPIEFQFKRQDGSVFPADVLTSPFPAGEELQFVAVVRDISSRKEAEKKIRDVSERLELAVRTHSIGVFDTDPQTGRAHWSEEMARIYGYPPREFQSVLAAHRHHVFPADLARMDAAIAKTLEAKDSELSYSFRIKRCDGQVRDIEASARFFYDADGNHVRRVGVNIDVTERKAAERRLAETQAELIHLSRLNSLGAVASSLGHELNQPLTAVANYISAAKSILQRQRAVEVETALEALQLASAGTLRAGELIKRLRLMSSKGEVKPQQVNLAELIQDTAALAIDQAGIERIALNVSIDGDAETAYADPILLQQVVFNLLRNAAQAMGATGGTITVQSSATSSGEVMISVEDTGAGLDPEVAANLFTAFMTTKSDGMGVGLSICRTIIEKSGGRIWAESDSRGTSFFFTLPSTTSDADHPLPA